MRPINRKKFLRRLIKGTQEQMTVAEMDMRFNRQLHQQIQKRKEHLQKLLAESSGQGKKDALKAAEQYGTQLTRAKQEEADNQHTYVELVRKAKNLYAQLMFIEKELKDTKGRVRLFLLAVVEWLKELFAEVKAEPDAKTAELVKVSELDNMKACCRSAYDDALTGAEEGQDLHQIEVNCSCGVRSVVTHPDL